MLHARRGREGLCPFQIPGKPRLRLPTKRDQQQAKVDQLKARSRRTKPLLKPHTRNSNTPRSTLRATGASASGRSTREIWCVPATPERSLAVRDRWAKMAVSVERPPAETQ